MPPSTYEHVFLVVIFWEWNCRDPQYAYISVLVDNVTLFSKVIEPFHTPTMRTMIVLHSLYSRSQTFQFWPF